MKRRQDKYVVAMLQYDEEQLSKIFWAAGLLTKLFMLLYVPNNRAMYWDFWNKPDRALLKEFKKKVKESNPDEPITYHIAPEQEPLHARNFYTPRYAKKRLFWGIPDKTNED